MIFIGFSNCWSYPLITVCGWHMPLRLYAMYNLDNPYQNPKHKSVQKMCRDFLVTYANLHIKSSRTVQICALDERKILIHTWENLDGQIIVGGFPPQLLTLVCARRVTGWLKTVRGENCWRSTPPSTARRSATRSSTSSFCCLIPKTEMSR